MPLPLPAAERVLAGVRLAVRGSERFVRKMAWLLEQGGAVLVREADAAQATLVERLAVAEAGAGEAVVDATWLVDCLFGQRLLPFVVQEMKK